MLFIIRGKARVKENTHSNWRPKGEKKRRKTRKLQNLQGLPLSPIVEIKRESPRSREI
jgi:hypothetical protein